MTQKKEKLPHRIGPASMHDDGGGEALGLILFCIFLMAGSAKAFDEGYTFFGYLMLLGGPFLTFFGFRSLLRKS